MSNKELQVLLGKYDEDTTILITTLEGEEFEDFVVDEGFGAIVLKEF